MIITLPPLEQAMCCAVCPCKCVPPWHTARALASEACLACLLACCTPTHVRAARACPPPPPLSFPLCRTPPQAPCACPAARHQHAWATASCRCEHAQLCPQAPQMTALRLVPKHLCMQAALYECNANHAVCMQVRRSTYHEVLKMSEAEELLDLNGALRVHACVSSCLMPPPPPY